MLFFSKLKERPQFWLLQVPVILFFSFCFWVTENGVLGRLENRFLREDVFPSLSRLTNFWTDQKFKSRGARPFKNKIVVVEVDSQALESLGRWPWHRDVTAQVIARAFEQGAKVVGLDIIFSEPDVRVPPELATVLKKKGMEKIISSFETDYYLEEVIRKYSSRLVLGWTTEQSCQPLYDGKDSCPVEDPSAFALYPPELHKFGVGIFQASQFKPALTPVISFFAPITNIPIYNSVASHAGYLNAFLDADGYIRRSEVIVFAAGKPYPSLPLEMARVGLNEEIHLEMGEDQRVKRLFFEKSGRALGVTPLGVLQINFRGPGSTINHLPVMDLMSEKDLIEDPVNQVLTGKSKSELLRDAYVIIGVSALGVFDMRQFPFESNAPGVDGHANILDNLLVGDSLQAGAGSLGSLVVLVLMTLGALVFAFSVTLLDAVPALVLFALLFLGSLFFDFRLIFGADKNWNTVFWYLEIVFIFVFSLALKYILEERNKKFIRSAFSKYVAPSVVDSILKDPAKLTLGGEKRELSVLFSDIRGFTTFSEQMDAKVLAAFLNDYLGIMTKIVFENHGTLDKYIGDAIMAFWGAPLYQENHASNAARAALQMIEAMEKNQARFKSQYGIDVSMGVGVNSGVVNVGNMGSDQNFSYTVIGDHVNLASRLEGLTKEYGAPAITSRFTFDLIERGLSGPLALGTLPTHRVLDQVRVKGRKHSVELIQLLSQNYSKEGLISFHEARKLYLQRRWAEAIVKFQKANELLGSARGPDEPCLIFIERCKEFIAHPPPEDWDGSWEMSTK